MTRPAQPEFDEYFLKIAAVVAERSTCLRHHVGAVSVRNRRILTTGYNGAAAGRCWPKDWGEAWPLTIRNNVLTIPKNGFNVRLV